MKNQHTQIYAKSSFGLPQMNCKEQIGCDGIEIQLVSELVGKNNGEVLKASDVFNYDLFNNVNVTVVHTPLIKTESWAVLETVTLENSVFTPYRKLLKQSFKIAEHFGKLNNKMVIVVVHCDYSLEKIESLFGGLKELEKMVYKFLDKYPHTILAIENTTPFYKSLTRRITFKNSFSFENVEMARHLSLKLGTDRVGTVLDTCHCLMSQRFYENVKQFHKDNEMDLSLESFFKTNEPYIKLIHLADCQNYGLGKKEHGIPFVEATPTFLEIVSLYDKYNYTCPITLEVREDDYLKCDSYRAEKALIDKYNIQ